MIFRQKHRDFLLFCLFEQIRSQSDVLAVKQRIADGMSLCFQEGVCHAAADYEAVALGQKVFDDADLVGNLRTAEDGDERTFRIFQSLTHDVKFLTDQEARHGRNVCCDTSSGGVRAVYGSECVGDIDIRKRSELLGKRGVVLFFFGIEAYILQQNDFPVLKRVNRCACGRSDRIFGERDLRIRKELRETFRYRREREFLVDFSLRTSEVRTENHFRVILKQVFDCGKSGDDPLVIRNIAICVDRYVEINADKHFLPGDIDITNCFFSHGALSFLSN